MKNKLGDLDNHLFAALERLGDEALAPEQIETEAKRATAIVAVADKLIANTAAKLQAARLYAEHGQAILPMLPLIGRQQQLGAPDATTAREGDE